MDNISLQCPAVSGPYFSEELVCLYLHLIQCLISLRFALRLHIWKELGVLGWLHGFDADLEYVGFVKGSDVRLELMQVVLSEPHLSVVRAVRDSGVLLRGSSACHSAAYNALDSFIEVCISSPPSLSHA